MSHVIVLLTLSAVAANGMHGTLLYRQRHNRRETISRHAAKNSYTFWFYIIGHIISATSFYLFARSFFSNTPHAQVLITITAIGCVADIIQAIIPARDEIEKYHTFSACVMALSVIAIGILAVATIPQTAVLHGLSVVLAICLSLSIPVSLGTENKYFYRVQMVSLLIFYIEMFVVVFGKA